MPSFIRKSDALSSRLYEARNTYHALVESGTYLTDTPVFVLIASGKTSGANPMFEGIVSPRRVCTLDNVLTWDVVLNVQPIR